MPARFFLITFLVAAAALGVSAQSGRMKPKETPSPTPERRIIYIPSNDRPRVAAPTPTPPLNTNDDSEDVISVKSVLVPIPVSVVDASGKSVTDLRLQDFVLTINGEAVEIGELARSESPIRLAMLFDNSSSVLAAREFEKKAAIRFFRQVLRPDRDLAALYSVSTVSRLEQGFTRDISALVRSIEYFPPPEGATALLDGIELAAEYLGDVQGRRVIVIVSDGDDTKTDTTFENALRKAQLWNCQIYVVRTTDFENFVRTRSRAGNANIRQLTAERRMLEFARQTGGAVYSPIDERELDDAFRRISAELAQQYVLSYYPDEDAGTRGELRTISVNIPGRSGLTIRARTGYYVP